MARATDDTGAAVDGASDAASEITAFLSGDASTVSRALRLVRAAIASRGFYIPADERNDVAGDTMMHLVQTLGSIDPVRQRSFDALVRTIAYRRCVDWMRRHRTHDEVQDEIAADLSPERDLLQRERVALGCKVIAELPAGCRELIRRYSCDGSTFREIAESDGRLEKTVRNQMYKCLDRARGVLRRLQRRDRIGRPAPERS